jgi:hypothetical protein
MPKSTNPYIELNPGTLGDNITQNGENPAADTPARRSLDPKLNKKVGMRRAMINIATSSSSAASQSLPVSEAKKTSVENFSELLNVFAEYVVKELDIKGDTKIVMKDTATFSVENTTFAQYNPNNQETTVSVTERHPLDVLRSVAHELVHHKQLEEGRLDNNSGETGSDIENEANAKAGVFLRNFGKANPDLFSSTAIEKHKEELSEAHYRITSKTSNKSLAKLSKRKDALGAQARTELKRRYDARDAEPKLKDALAQITDKLAKGQKIDPDLLAHVKKASPKSLQAVINKAKKAREHTKILSKAKREGAKEAAQKLSVKHAEEIKALKKASRKKKKPPSVGQAFSVAPASAPVPAEKRKTVLKSILDKAFLKMQAAKPEAPKPPTAALPPKVVTKDDIDKAVSLNDFRVKYMSDWDSKIDDAQLYRELVKHYPLDQVHNQVWDWRRRRANNRDYGGSSPRRLPESINEARAKKQGFISKAIFGDRAKKEQEAKFRAKWEAKKREKELFARWDNELASKKNGERKKTKTSLLSRVKSAIVNRVKSKPSGGSDADVHKHKDHYKTWSVAAKAALPNDQIRHQGKDYNKRDFYQSRADSHKKELHKRGVSVGDIEVQQPEKRKRTPGVRPPPVQAEGLIDGALDFIKKGDWNDAFRS